VARAGPEPAATPVSVVPTAAAAAVPAVATEIVVIIPALPAADLERALLFLQLQLLRPHLLGHVRRHVALVVHREVLLELLLLDGCLFVRLQVLGALLYGSSK
jgi:hypothetical protein